MSVDRETVYLRLRRDHLTRLRLLLKAMEEKMGKEMTLAALIEKIIDDFLNS